MQKYLKAKSIKRFEAQLLFKFRTRMEDFGENFKNGNENIVCRLCKDDNKMDSQNHLLECPIINNLLPETKGANLRDIYSKDELKNKKIVEILVKAMKSRCDLLPQKKKNRRSISKSSD